MRSKQRNFPYKEYNKRRVHGINYFQANKVAPPASTDSVSAVSSVFGGLGVSMLASSPKDRGFAPDRSRRIFPAGKIHSMPSFVQYQNNKSTRYEQILKKKSSRVQTRPKPSDFFSGRKNPQHAFLRKGSKAVGPVSQICGT
jgi:hypothetical protein